MEKNWTKIFSSNNPNKTEIIKQVLEENEIISIKMNQQDSSYNMFGTIDLYVKDKDIEGAKKIISNQNE